MKLQHPVKIIRNQKELDETNPIIKKFEENKENVGTNKWEAKQNIDRSYIYIYIWESLQISYKNVDKDIFIFDG